MQKPLFPGVSACCLIWGGFSLLSMSVMAVPFVGKPEVRILPQAETEQLHLYIVELSAEAALEPGRVNPNQLSALSSQQQDFIQKLYVRFGGVEVQSRSRLLGNSLAIKLTETQARELSNMEEVKRLSLASAGLPLPAPLNLEIQAAANIQAEAIQADMSVGKGVKIALLSTGIDYTHASFGGPGTPEAYQHAWRYAGVPFDGFPTTVVTRGRDFFSEREPNVIVPDTNPIDSALDSSGTSGGRGTAMASIIHQLAPGAELWAGKIYRASRVGTSVYPLGPNTTQLQQALEWALDPNADGDTSDRADIIVLDIAGFGPGFYSEKDVWTDTYAAMAQNIQKAASLGTLILVAQGEGNAPGGYMTPIQAVAPAALAVGMANVDEETPRVTAQSLRGPLRGDVDAVKPDLVSQYAGQQIAIVGTGDGIGIASDAMFALARVAATAAALKSIRPQLNGIELKALLVNSADNQIMAATGSSLAPISLVGAGLEDAAAAAASKIVAWELASGLPGLHFGHPEVRVSQQYQIQKELYIRNLTDKPQVYTLSASHREDGPDSSALSWQLPAQITVPANRAVTVSVILTIDGSLLPEWPLTSSDDYSADKWRASEMDGYLLLEDSEGKAEAHIPWLVRPRAAADIQAHFDTYREQFSFLNINGPGFPLGEALFDTNYAGREQEFQNTSAHDVTFNVLPIVARNRQPRDAAAGAKGGMIMQNLASAVVPEARCEAGKKLTLAVTLFTSRALPFRSYFDTPLNGSLDMYIVRSEILTDYPDLSIQEVFSFIEDKDLVLESFVTLDETGIPVAYYHDLNIPVNPADPAASLKVSKLPVRFATDSRNLIVDYCLEELLRDDLTLADLNQNLGYWVRTDRDTLPGTREPFIPFNPVNMGPIETRYEYDWFGNLVEVISNQANFVALSAKGGATPVADYVNELTLAPGQRATLTAVMDGFCEYTGQCGKGFVLLADNADYQLWSPLTLGDDSGFVAAPRQGQLFSVADNAEAGQLIGTIQLESQAFFNIAGGEAAADYELRLTSPLTDNALRVTRQGEIYVDNAAALNANGVSTYHLKVFGQIKGSEILISPSVEVLVNVYSTNAAAPVLRDPTGSNLTGIAGEALQWQLTLLFEDADGDELSFSSSDLPAGLTLNTSTGILSGRIQSAGEYQFILNVSDGHHHQQFPFSLNINAAPSGSGGMAGIGLLLLLLLCWQRRVFN